MVWQSYCHDKKVQTVSLNPVQPHFLATASLDRSIKIFDLRRMPKNAYRQNSSSKASKSPMKDSKVKQEEGDDDEDISVEFEAPDVSALCTFNDSHSVNCAYWNPIGTALVSVTQSNYIHLFSNPHLTAGGIIFPNMHSSICIFLSCFMYAI